MYIVGAGAFARSWLSEYVTVFLFELNGNRLCHWKIWSVVNGFGDIGVCRTHRKAWRKKSHKSPPTPDMFKVNSHKQDLHVVNRIDM